MKPIYVIPFLAIALSSQAQTTNTANTPRSATITEDNVEVPDGNTVYNSTGLQVQPEYPGGHTAFSEFIRSNFNTPTAEDGPKTVKTYVSFVIEKDGSLADIRILKDPGYGVGEETKRVLRLSPKWKPGEQNNKPVRTQFNLPITLNLERPATSKIKKRG